MQASETFNGRGANAVAKVSIPAQMQASETLLRNTPLTRTEANLRNFRQNLQGFKINLTFAGKPINY